ncbi:MAG TPA: hypothetical protein VJC07_03210 [Candidatus Nanoarchaeia archaeon]|nr:hypothetical protein [Candidatus Nanoarchaeia archaeon]
MNKLIVLMSIFLLALTFTAESASAIFLGGEEWFGRPITRGSMNSMDDLGINFAGSRSSGSASNDFTNQLLNGQFAFDDIQSFQDASQTRTASGNVVGGVGDGSRMTRQVVVDRRLIIPGRNNNVREMLTITEFGGEFNNYNLNSFNTQSARSTQNARSINAGLSVNNQRNTGSSASSQDSINAAFGARASRSFAINLNRFF